MVVLVGNVEREVFFLEKFKVSCSYFDDCVNGGISKAVANWAGDFKRPSQAMCGTDIYF